MDRGRMPMLGRRARDLVCAAAVIAMVAHNYFNVRAVRDIGPDDEAWYVAGGVLAGKPGFPNGPNGLPIPELGALHCLSYYPLSKIYRAPVDLYYASWQIRTTLLALAIFASVRLARRPWWQALLASFAFVNCAIADVWPFPVHTAALVVLGGVIAASLVGTTTGALGSVTIAFAVAGFCRPELLYGYGVALAALVVHLGRAKKLRSRWLFAAIATGLLLFLVLGNPLGGTRSYYAFAQHYTRALYTAEGSRLDPWANWPAVVQRDFPGAATIGQAMRTNPRAFAHHVARNIRTLPEAFFAVTRPRLPTSDIVEFIVWTAALAFAVVHLRRMWLARAALAASPTRTALLFALGSALVPFVMSILVVHPRQHYFAVVVILTMTLIATCPLPAPRRFGVGVHAVLVASACIACVVFTSTKSDAATVLEWLANNPAKRELYGEHQHVVADLRRRKLEGHIVALEYAWGTCFYAGYDCESILRFEKQAPFDRFVAERHVDIILFDDTMAHDPRFIDDEEFLDFVARPPAHGFEVESIRDSGVRIAIRRR